MSHGVRQLMYPRQQAATIFLDGDPRLHIYVPIHTHSELVPTECCHKP